MKTFTVDQLIALIKATKPTAMVTSSAGFTKLEFENRDQRELYEGALFELNQRTKYANK